MPSQKQLQEEEKKRKNIVPILRKVKREKKQCECTEERTNHIIHHEPRNQNVVKIKQSKKKGQISKTRINNQRRHQIEVELGLRTWMKQRKAKRRNNNTKGTEHFFSPMRGKVH